MKTGAPASNITVLRDRRWRNATSTQGFFLIGTLLWLIGSATFVGSQPRLQLNISSSSISAAVTSGGLFDASWILWISASCFWIVGAFLHLMTAHVQATLVTVSGVRPGIAKWMVLSAWLQLVATILVLVGSAVFSGGTLNSVSAGAILILTGFTMWGHAILIDFGIAFIISTVSVIMPDPLQRQFAWSNIVALLFLLVQFILLNLASVVLVVRDPPGVWLTAGLLYIIGSIFGIVGWSIHFHGVYGYYTPIVGFVSTALMTNSALVATGVGGTVGTGTAGKGIPGTSAYPGSTMGTGPYSATSGTTAYPGSTMGTGPYSATPTNVSTVPVMPPGEQVDIPVNISMGTPLGMETTGTTPLSTTPTAGALSMNLQVAV